MKNLSVDRGVLFIFGLGFGIILSLFGCGRDEKIAGSQKINPPPSTTNPPAITGPLPSPKATEFHVEDFVGTHTQKQDFLFVIDNSGSMNNKIAAVKQNLKNFTDSLQQRRVVDYQMAFTTADALGVAGALVKSLSGIDVVQSTVSGNSVAEVSDILSRLPSTSSLNLEMGLASAELALTQSKSRFTRAGVPLALIIMSDAEDQSCDPSDPLCYTDQTQSASPHFISTTHYVDTFKNVGVPVLMFPLVGGPISEGSATPQCSGLEGFGSRYVTVAKALGTGITGSICQSSLAQNFIDIAEHLSKRGICFPLKKTASGKSITVSVDGKDLKADPNSGFVYETSTNSICFPGNLLIDDKAKIHVRYEVHTPQS